MKLIELKAKLTRKAGIWLMLLLLAVIFVSFGINLIASEGVSSLPFPAPYHLILGIPILIIGIILIWVVVPETQQT